MGHRSAAGASRRRPDPGPADAVGAGRRRGTQPALDRRRRRRACAGTPQARGRRARAWSCSPLLRPAVSSRMSATCPVLPALFGEFRR